MKPSNRNASAQDKVSPSTRRHFLQQTVGLTADPAAVPSLAQDTYPGANTSARLLPTLKLGSQQVTRLFIGGNPIFGQE
jgi:hypothetical protein